MHRRFVPMIVLAAVALAACTRRPANVSADVLRQAAERSLRGSSSSSEASEEFVPKLVMPKTTTPKAKPWILKVPQKEERK